MTTTLNPPPGLSLPVSAYSTYWQTIGLEAFSNTLTTNALYARVIKIPIACTITGIQVVNDSVVSGNLMIVLYNILGTAQVGVSASTAQTGTFGPQRVPFSSPGVIQPGVYIAGMIADNATGKYVVDSYSIEASVIISPGSFTIPGTITPPAVTSRASLPICLSTY